MIESAVFAVLIIAVGIALGEFIWHFYVKGGK